MLARSRKPARGDPPQSTASANPNDHSRTPTIRRQRTPKDRRSVLVELTPDGRAVIDKAAADLVAAEAALLGELKPREWTALSELLAQLVASLEKRTNAIHAK